MTAPKRRLFWPIFAMKNNELYETERNLGPSNITFVQISLPLKLPLTKIVKENIYSLKEDYIGFR